MVPVGIAEQVAIALGADKLVWFVDRLPADGTGRIIRQASATLPMKASGSPAIGRCSRAISMPPAAVPGRLQMRYKRSATGSSERSQLLYPKFVLLQRLSGVGMPFVAWRER